MKKFYIIFLFLIFSCDSETPIKENFVVEAFLFQGEKVDDIKIKKTELWNSLDSIDKYISDAKIKLFGKTRFRLSKIPPPVIFAQPLIKFFWRSFEISFT